MDIRKECINLLKLENKLEYTWNRQPKAIPSVKKRLIGTLVCAASSDVPL